jgi:hypothetical protein
MKGKLKLRYKILLGLSASLLVVVALAYLMFRLVSGAATAYKPDCTSDAACGAWVEFRTKHPYPYQELAAKRLPDSTVALIISEPPPALSKASLDQVVKAAFGDDLLDSRRRRWTLLTDGWLEDLVLKVKIRNGALDPVMEDSTFRERIAVLCNELFGTTFGGMVDFFAEASAASTAGAPNIYVSPAELRSWVTQSALMWHSLNDDRDTQAIRWQDLVRQKESGAFASTDGNLIMLTLPINFLLNARTQPHALDSLRTPFRMFAVASDCVLGGLWALNEQHMAIVARARTRPLTEVPPLRFETFELLATQYADELSQSYERTAIFAGKLNSGDYALKDWAPIYLSESLIDTEFGALLNTTDQLLKSWSEAGTVEYQYFNNPKPGPGQYPFGEKTLSEVLDKETGSKSVTFNWNTAGFGVVVARPDVSVLAAKQVGALPVTYLAGKEDEHLRHMVLKHEDDAYGYFASRRDPNLERVVQYTTLYQLFRAIEKGTNSSSRPRNGTSSARAAAAEVLAEETAQLLDDLQAGKLTKSPAAYTADLNSKITAFQSAHPEIANAVLARILANRFSQEAVQYAESRREALQNARAKLDSAQALFNRDVDAYNRRLKSPSLTQGGPDLLATKQALDKRREDLDNRLKVFGQQDQEDPIDELRERVANLGSAERDLDVIRKRYLEKIPKTSGASIKTPSIVLSWAGRDVLVSVGGHNLDARTLKLEMTTDVSDAELKTTDDGYILRYNPSRADAAEATATELAYAIEHDRVEGPKDVDAILGKKNEIRSPMAALELPAETGPGMPWEHWGQLGTKTYSGKDAFVEDLRTVADKNECCVFIAQDDHGVSYVTEKNATPPPAVLTLEVRDTPSLTDYVKQVSARAGSKNVKEIVFLDSSEAHVEALTLGLRGPDQPGPTLEFDRAVSQSGVVKGTSRTDALLGRDLRGRPSFIERISQVVGGGGRDLLEHLGIIQPREVWGQVQTTVLDAGSVRDFLRELDWEPARDGVPSAIKVSFGPGENVPSDLSVIAGFNNGDSPLAKDRLEAAHRENVAAASTNGASVAQYVMGIKNDLRGLTDVQLKRLVVVVNDKQETRIFMSRRNRDDGALSGS